MGQGGPPYALSPRARASTACCRWLMLPSVPRVCPGVPKIPAREGRAGGGVKVHAGRGVWVTSSYTSLLLRPSSAIPATIAE
jgi:hypothetical protein